MSDKDKDKVIYPHSREWIKSIISLISLRKIYFTTTVLFQQKIKISESLSVFNILKKKGGEKILIFDFYSKTLKGGGLKWQKK